MKKTKNAVSSKNSGTKTSKSNAIADMQKAFAATIATAKNHFITRIALALFLIGAMWYASGMTADASPGLAMLYLLAENGKKSGRAGGNVYMRNGRIRGFTMPSNPMTAYQTQQRSNLGTLSAGWNSLTNAQRLAWNAFSVQDTDRFGNLVFISGKAAYVALNRNLYNTADAAISDPPLPVGIPSPSSLSIAIDDSTNTFLLTFAPDPIPAGNSWLVYATGPQSSGTYSPSASKYRLVTALSGGTASGEDINAAYVARFGAPVTGQKIFVKIVAIGNTTGIASAPIVASSVVVA